MFASNGIAQRTRRTSENTAFLSMKKRTRYTDEPLGDLKVIPDFLPAPDELAFKDQQVKVTIGLSKASVDFFRQQAKKHGTQYQKMIRRLLDLYVNQHQRRTAV